MMRRKLLGSAAVWLVGGALLAGDEPLVNVLGILPDPAPPAGSVAGAKPWTGPVVQPLQRLATPDGVAIKQVSAQTPQATVALPAPAPAVVSQEPMVETAPAAGGPTADPGRVFGHLDYVLFWIKRNPTPPLVQTLPASLGNFKGSGGPLPPGAGTTLFGGDGPDRTDKGSFNGVRVQLGTYIDDAKCWGIDGSYLQLAQKSANFAIASNGIPVIGRDFFDVSNNQDTFLRYSTPDGLTSGFIRATAPTEMYTFDANLRTEGPSVLSDRVDYFIGLRYLNLRDSVTIDSGVTIRDPNGAPPFTITSHEAFKASNEFYASQVGLETHYHWGCFSIEFTGKVAVGWVHQDVRIDGGSTSQIGGAAPIAFPNQSILFVQPSNAGSYSRNKFAIMPEGLVNLGYQVTPHLRATVGYDVWALSSVERSGAAIDTNINPSQTKFIATQQQNAVKRPTFSFVGADDWWANGLTLGLAFTY